MNKHKPVKCDICSKAYCCDEAKKVKRVLWLGVDWLICLDCIEEGAKKQKQRKERNLFDG